MSHYTVAVFTTGADADIDLLLAPYDEGIQVAPYVSETKEQIIEHARANMQRVFETSYAKWKQDPFGYELNANPEHIAYLRSLPEQMQQTDEELYQERILGYTPEELSAEGGIMSTYNPKSKWDWYTVGGRWQGMLILKPDKTGIRCSVSLDTPMTEGYDGAYVSDIDFDAMRQKCRLSMQSYADARKNSLYSEEYFLKLYPSEDEYIRHLTSFSTYAVVTPDGTWHAPGDMGWWGFSSEGGEQKREWSQNYHERFMMPAAENGWYLTVVDCHI